MDAVFCLFKPFPRIFSNQSKILGIYHNILGYNIYRRACQFFAGNPSSPMVFYAFLFFVIWAADVFAYLVGSKIGQNASAQESALKLLKELWLDYLAFVGLTLMFFPASLSWLARRGPAWIFQRLLGTAGV